MKKNVSISARIDSATEEEMDFLERELGIDKTNIVIAAIHYLSNAIKRKKGKKSPFEILKKSGFIAAFEGSPTFSEDYKKEFATSLREKHAAYRATTRVKKRPVIRRSRRKILRDR